jgi:hypothetical protein
LNKSTTDCAGRSTLVHTTRALTYERTIATSPPPCTNIHATLPNPFSCTNTIATPSWPPSILHGSTTNTPSTTSNDGYPRLSIHSKLLKARGILSARQNLIYQKKKQQHTPYTAPWLAQRLKENSEIAAAHLRQWVHPKRLQEATKETVRFINNLPEKWANEALDELRKPKPFIRGTNGQQFDLKVQLRTTDDRRSFAVKALIDSGCTGSMINSEFVKHEGINVTKAARPIPVYNADGTLNKDGSITAFVTMEMKVASHTK